jgi:iron uptake system EfeUOB component EfeO/EfeM
LSSQGSALIKAVTALKQAIAAGDLAQAQALYLPARAAYSVWPLPPSAWRSWTTASTLAPITSKNASRIRPSSASTASNTALFQQRSLDGLNPVAERLLADVTTLKQQLLAQSLPPEQLVSIVVRNLNTLADVRAASGEEERYSHADLGGFAANLETAQSGRAAAADAEQVGAGPAAENRRGAG